MLNIAFDFLFRHVFSTDWFSASKLGEQSSVQRQLFPYKDKSLCKVESKAFNTIFQLPFIPRSLWKSSVS